MDFCSVSQGFREINEEEEGRKRTQKNSKGEEKCRAFEESLTLPAISSPLKIAGQVAPKPLLFFAFFAFFCGRLLRQFVHPIIFTAVASPSPPRETESQRRSVKPL